MSEIHVTFLSAIVKGRDFLEKLVADVILRWDLNTF
jgi:hypothetical protein